MDKDTNRQPVTQDNAGKLLEQSLKEVLGVSKARGLKRDQIGDQLLAEAIRLVVSNKDDIPVSAWCDDWLGRLKIKHESHSKFWEFLREEEKRR